MWIHRFLSPQLNCNTVFGFSLINHLFKILTGYNLDSADINKLVGKFANQQASTTPPPTAPTNRSAPVVTTPEAIQAERTALTALLQNITDPTLAAKYKERFKLRTGQDY